MAADSTVNTGLNDEISIQQITTGNSLQIQTVSVIQGVAYKNVIIFFSVGWSLIYLQRAGYSL